jgi:hypothetical protein
LERAVMVAFEEEKLRSVQPGYVCRYDEYDEE